ncbi:MAG: hypothetical protein WCT53_00620 [Candidatus Gracilibacteria bacterium]
MKNYKNFTVLLCGLIGFLTFSIGEAFAAQGTPAITSATFKVGSDKMLVTFNMPVYGNANGTGALDCNDFVIASGNGAVGFQNLSGAACSHSAGNNWAVIEFADAQAADSGDSSDTVRAAINSIFTVGGALSEATVNLTQDTTAPTFSVTYKQAKDKLVLAFSEPVFTTDYSSPATAFSNAPVSNADFTFTDGDASGSSALSSAAIQPIDKTYAILDLDAELNADDLDGTGSADKISGRAAGDAASIYDIHGNAVASSTLTLGSTSTSGDTVTPQITSVEAVKDKSRILVTFSEPVFTDESLGSLNNAAITNDLLYIDVNGTKTLNAATAVSHSAGDRWVLLTISGDVSVYDFNIDTVAAAEVEAAIFDAFGAAMPRSRVFLTDTTTPTITGVALGKTNNKNTVTITYSEDVKTASGDFSPAFGTSSSSSMGDTTEAGVIAGLGRFGTIGNAAYITQKNTVAIDTTGSVITVTMAGQDLGIKTSAGTTEPSGTFTPAAGCSSCVADLSPNSNRIESTSIVRTISGNGSWDLTPPASVSGLEVHVSSISSVNLIWALPSMPADFKEYTVYYRAGTPGVTITNGTAWTRLNDTSLSTISSSGSTTVTGLRTGERYYFIVATLDLAGNASFSSEVTGSVEVTNQTDSTPPSLPTNIKATINAAGKVVLTWTDPTAADLLHIEIARGRNGEQVSGIYTTVLKNAQTYTDTSVTVGDKINYVLRAVDTNSNKSTQSDTVAITVTAPVSNAQDQVQTQAQNQNQSNQQSNLTSQKTKLQKQIDVINKAIANYNKSITKYDAKIAKLNIKKKADRIKIAKYKKSIANMRKTIKKKQTQVEKMVKKLG